jgi:hypothetical protein
MYYKKLVFVMTIFLVIGFLSFGVRSAWAEAPANDDFDYPTVITSLPFTEQSNTAEATLAGDDPRSSCDWWTLDRTVWYKITPTADQALWINTSGSDHQTGVFIYTGIRGSLSEITGTCYEGINGVRFQAKGATSYYIAVSQDSAYANTESNLVVNVEDITPANNAFANATVVNSIPFEETTNMEFATMEPNERTFHIIGHMRTGPFGMPTHLPPQVPTLSTP